MCEVEFGPLPLTPNEKKELQYLKWAQCVANKAAERPGEWCKVFASEHACRSWMPECGEFEGKREALYALTIRYRYEFEISQKLGVSGSGSGELWIREPRGLFQAIKQMFTK